MITEEQIKDALKQVKYPGYTRDIVSFGLVSLPFAVQWGIVIMHFKHDY